MTIFICSLSHMYTQLNLSLLSYGQQFELINVPNIIIYNDYYLVVVQHNTNVIEQIKNIELCIHIPN